MKFVLIVVISAMGGGGMNQWRQPSFAMAQFENDIACNSAARDVALLVKQARLEYAEVKTACVPAGFPAEEKK